MSEINNGYIAPALISEVDDDVIHARMLENLPDDIDKTEGGFAHDFTRPAALEKAELLIAINDAIQVFFPAWSYGTYLDMIASQVGLTRRSATYAETTLSITGAEGTLIPAGFLWSTAGTAITESIQFETVESVVIGPEGTATVHVRCTQTGPVGNVPENSITLMVSPMGGIAEIKNESPATGGSDIETDDELRARIEERDLSGEASFVGCDADYKRWAREVDGVGDVIVIPEWQGPGTGTVKLIVMDINGSPANESLLRDVYNHIMSEQDRDNRLAPIGAILTVVTASIVTISISAKVVLTGLVELEDVKTAFTALLRTYFATAKAEGEIKYTKVGAVLSETPGVADYKELKINGGVENISVYVDDYPVADSITLTEVD